MSQTLTLTKQKYKRNSCWDYFQKWYVITLLKSDVTDITTNLNRSGIKNYEILRYKGVKKRINCPKDSSLYKLLVHTSYDETADNIVQNHKKTIKNALDKGYDNVVILEDDSRFDLPIDSDKIIQVVNWLKTHEWDIFFFGHCPWPYPLSFPQTRFIVKCYSPMLAHCYVLSRSGMTKLLEETYAYPKMQIDKVFSKSNKLKKYAIFPSIAHQCVPPAIYREIMKKLNLSNSYFRKINTILEYIAVALPIIILLIFIYYLLKFFYSRFFANNENNRYQNK